MSKKDYELIAEVVSKIPEIALVNPGKRGSTAFHIRRDIAREFAFKLKEKNERFDTVRFFTACGLVAE